MRFLLLTQYYPPELGAAQARLEAFVAELIANGHEVEVVTALPNYPLGRIFPAYPPRLYHHESNGYVTHRTWIYAARGAGLARLASFLSFCATSPLALARAKRPDYVIVESPPPFLTAVGWAAARGWGARLILFLADLWPDSARELGLLSSRLALAPAEWFERWTLDQADCVTAVTQGMLATLRGPKRVPDHKLLFLPNGIDLARFTPMEPDLELARKLGVEGRKVVLYAGTHGHAHGLDVAIDAAALLADTPVTFVFVGDGSDRDRVLGLADARQLTNTLFLPPQDADAVARLYSIATCGLSTLRGVQILHDARPAKVLASMATARPVAYSGAGEGARLVEEAGAGLVTPPGDAAALAGSIRRLIDDPDLAREMGESGRRFVERSLGWPSLVRDWLEQLSRADLAIDRTVVPSHRRS